MYGEKISLEYIYEEAYRQTDQLQILYNKLNENHKEMLQIYMQYRNETKAKWLKVEELHHKVLAERKVKLKI